ncbi:MAG: phytase [Phycisphaerae bacterium]|nr:NHL repeat-containing protein [Phycisphaerae bacterium]NUQ46954.1 phytase [Phycisphaerae bacterium]
MASRVVRSWRLRVYALILLPVAIALLGVLALVRQHKIAVEPVVVAERFRTTAPHGESDSLAVWRDADSGTAWLFVTDKHGDRVQLFDAATGEYLRDLGTSGAEPGQFLRPNGVAVWSRADRPSLARTDLLLVVERNGARVQAFSLPDLQPMTAFGAGELEKPYGIAVAHGEDGLPVVFVTDNSKSPTNRIRRYDARIDIERTGTPAANTVASAPAVEAPGLQFACTRAFGDAGGPGLLRFVESIAHDPEHGRLYVADESPRSRNVKVYSDDGAFLGHTFGDGYIHFEPEGIALWRDGREGWIIVTDQQPELSVFHVFDRRTLGHQGAFIGRPTVANTDGVALVQGALGSLAGGAFFAVDNDAVVAAFAWDDIAAAVELKRTGH